MGWLRIGLFTFFSGVLQCCRPCSANACSSSPSCRSVSLSGCGRCPRTRASASQPACDHDSSPLTRTRSRAPLVATMLGQLLLKLGRSCCSRPCRPRRARTPASASGLICGNAAGRWGSSWKWRPPARYNAWRGQLPRRGPGPEAGAAVSAVRCLPDGNAAIGYHRFPMLRR